MTGNFREKRDDEIDYERNRNREPHTETKIITLLQQQDRGLAHAVAPLHARVASRPTARPVRAVDNGSGSDRLTRTHGLRSVAMVIAPLPHRAGAPQPGAHPGLPGCGGSCPQRHWPRAGGGQPRWRHGRCGRRCRCEDLLPPELTRGRADRDGREDERGRKARIGVGVSKRKNKKPRMKGSRRTSVGSLSCSPTLYLPVLR